MKTNYLAAVLLGLMFCRISDAQDLRISVDRASGAVSLENVGDSATELKGYTIGSEGSFLSLDNWSSLTDAGNAGWREANPSTSFLSELNRNDTLVLAPGSATTLGDSYLTGAHIPDLFFEYITTERVVTEGTVHYTGPANDLAVYVDPTTGDASIANLSPFLDPISIKGYSILSTSSGLTVDTWSSISGSIGNGWGEANPAADHLSELNRFESTAFGNSNPISIGKILAPGSDVRDLVFEYFTTDGEVLEGSVEYIPLPGSGSVCDPNTGGDLDGNGMVAFADFLILSANFGSEVSSHAEGDIDCSGDVAFADFLVLSANFGQSIGAVSPVPEPSGLTLLTLASFGVIGSLRRKR